MKARKTLMAALVVSGFALTGVSATSASASTKVPVQPNYGNCRTWHDGNTFGASCTGGGGAAYRAVATCKNGQTIGGPYEGGNSGAWSYAYCTSVHSSLKSGHVEWFL